MTLDELRQAYAAKNARSRQLHEMALGAMPGGNARTTIFFDPYPFYAVRGEGPRIWDADGNERLDFNGNYTSLILGHRHPAVVKAVTEQMERGISFPAPSEEEIRLAQLITTRVPSVEQIRFTNSGTEATLNAIRAARAFTGRDRIAKFEGAYHGTHDAVQVSIAPPLAEAGSRRRPKPVPSSLGVPKDVVKNTIILPYNHPDAVEAIVARQADKLAAIIVEPLLGIGGLIAPEPGFLQRLRDLADRHGTLLIFDEVITFRVASGGAQSLFGVRPDLTTFGKIIGGGFPVGAFGGRAEIMSLYDPRGGRTRISHGGTFNANPITMAAGLATLEQLTPEAYGHLERLGERLRSGVIDLFRSHKVKAQITGMGSLFCLHWTGKPLRDFRSSLPTEPERPMRIFLGLVNEGIMLSQRGLGCCSLPMGEDDVNYFLTALTRVITKEMR